MSETTKAEIEAQSGQKVRVTSVPSALDKKLNGSEESEYEATLLGVETIGGHAGMSEQTKIAVDTEDGETEHISMSAWNNDPEEGETGVTVVDDDTDDDTPEVRTDGGRVDGGSPEETEETEAQYETLADMAGEGWLSSEREEVDPPMMRWSVGGWSAVLPGDYTPAASVPGVDAGYTEGSTTVTRYVTDGRIVETDVDTHDPSGPYRVRVTGR